MLYTSDLYFTTKQII